MVHAAATWLGLFLIGLVATQGANAVALAACTAGCALASVYLFGVERANLGAMLSALAGLLARVPALFRGAARTMRAIVAADVTLRPALVQVKTYAEDDFSLGATVCAMSASPGVVAVDASGESILVHVIEERDDSAADLRAIEASIVQRNLRGPL